MAVSGKQVKAKTSRDVGRRTRCLFSTESSFYQSEDGRTWNAAPYAAALWSRFLSHFAELDVLARLAPPLSGSSLNLADRDRVVFTLLPAAGRWKRLVRILTPVHPKIRAAVAAADAVVVRLPSEQGLLTVREAKRQHKPVAVEVVGCAWDGHRNSGSLAGWLYAPIAKARMRTAVASSAFALYVTSGFLQARYPSSGHQIAASNVSVVLDPDVLTKRISRLGGRASGARWIFGTVGTIAQPQKGVQTALKALSQLPRGLDFEYLVLGSGDPEPYRKVARRYGIEDRVRFSGGSVPAAEVIEWLDDIDLYLQPSLHEGLPRALIEAMSRGLPAIGSMAGGIPELLPPEFTHAVGDADALTARIAQLVSLPAGELIAIAERNFAVATAFDEAALAERRDVFYAAFAIHAGATE